MENEHGSARGQIGFQAKSNRDMKARCETGGTKRTERREKIENKRGLYRIAAPITAPKTPVTIPSQSF